MLPRAIFCKTFNMNKSLLSSNPLERALLIWSHVTGRSPTKTVSRLGFRGCCSGTGYFGSGLAALTFAVAYFRFSFAERSTRPRPIEADAEKVLFNQSTVTLPRAQLFARFAMGQIHRLVQDPLHGHGKKYILRCDCCCITLELHSQSCPERHGRLWQPDPPRDVLDS